MIGINSNIPFERVPELPPNDPIIPTLDRNLPKEEKAKTQSVALKVLKSPLTIIAVDQFVSILKYIFSMSAHYAKYIPYLTIAGIPFYFYSSVKESYSRSILTYMCLKTSQIQDVALNAARAANSVGTSLSDFLRPFAGGYQISGIKGRYPVLTPVINTVIPIAMITFGSLGVATEGASLIQNVKALRKLKREAKDPSLEKIGRLLTRLKKQEVPSKNKPLDRARVTVANQKLMDRYFTSEKRYLQVAKQIDQLFNKKDEFQIHIDAIIGHILKLTPTMDPILGIDENVRFIQSQLFDEISSLQEELNNDAPGSFLPKLDRLLSLYDQLGLLFETDKLSHFLEGHDLSVTQMRSDIVMKKEELVALKNEILKSGSKIIDIVRSETHRHILNHVLFIFLAVLAIVAGAIFLASPSYFVIAGSIAIIASVLDAVMFLGDKTISQDRFLRIERALHILPKNQEMEPPFFQEVYQDITEEIVEKKGKLVALKNEFTKWVHQRTAMPMLNTS